jgi:hypothetical protein
MKEGRIGPLLRELPRERAGDGFTARVLARLDRPEPAPPAGRRRLVLAAASLAMLAMLAVSAALVTFDGPARPADRPRRPQDLPRRQPLRVAAAPGPQALPREADALADAARRLAQLRSRHDRLERELRALERSRRAAAPPVVYVGGDDHVDLVVDLRRVRRDEAARPAAYRYEVF